MFTASKLFWYFAAPSSWLVITPLLALLLLYLRKHVLTTILLSIYSVIMLAIIFTPVHYWLISPLEQRFPNLSNDTLPETITGIIVLGGSMEENMSVYHGQAILNSAAERMTATTELALQYPDATIVLSGGSGLLGFSSNITEAEVARDFLITRGISSSRMVLEEQSRNTAENIRYSRGIIKPDRRENWLLVTSAYHIPRSMGIFRQQNWHVIPYPVDYRSAPSSVIDTNHAVLERLQVIDTACREYVGLIAYKILGHTNHFFPAP